MQPIHRALGLALVASVCCTPASTPTQPDSAVGMPEHQRQPATVGAPSGPPAPVADAAPPPADGIPTVVHGRGVQSVPVRGRVIDLLVGADVAPVAAIFGAPFLGERGLYGDYSRPEPQVRARDDGKLLWVEVPLRALPQGIRIGDRVFASTTSFEELVSALRCEPPEFLEGGTSADCHGFAVRLSSASPERLGPAFFFLAVQ